MTLLASSIKTCSTPGGDDQSTSLTADMHPRSVRRAKWPWLPFAEFIRESGANLHRFLRLIKAHRIRQAATLSVVKLMDYSDHLSLRTSPTPHRIFFQERDFFTSTLKEQFSDLANISRELTWRFDENAKLEISYNASLGETEVHPHLTHAFLKCSGGKRLLHIRYFDDESTIWQRNSCRASTITVAEITIDAQTHQLQALRYFRFRSPKRNKFNRKDTLARLNVLLDSSLLFSGIDPHLITFGLEYSSQAQQILCRYATDSRCALQRWVNKILVYSQLSVVMAILKENIAFTKLGSHRHDEFATASQCSSEEKRPSSVLRNKYGKKQLRLRLL